MTCALAAADWICGDSLEYGTDGAGYYVDHHNQVVSDSFVLAGTEGARLDIAALGCYSVRVNGRCLDGVELSGDWTNYSKAVYYDSFDISGMVRAGENEIAVELGNGMYNPAPLTMFGKYNLRERLSEVGTPKVACVVTQGGETVLKTDSSWTWTEGQLLFNNLYLGERRDMAFVDRDPKPVRSVPNGRRLERGVVPKCVRAHAIVPVGSVACGEGTLFDFGEMVAGFIHLSFGAAAGTLVEVSYAETLDDDGAPSYESNAAGLVGVMTPRGRVPGGPGAPEMAVERDLIACREGENDFVNEFTLHSFRYALVKGLDASAITRVEAIPVHTDLVRTGRVETGNADLGLLLDAAVRTKLNNVHGVFEDCSRERFGYGGDMVALATSNLLSFDVSGMIDKTLADFRRDQTARGGLPETAPFVGIGSNGPAYGEGPLLWQLAYPYLALRADQYYGRRDLLEREWPGLASFGDYLLSFDPAELSTHCLGDHGALSTAEDFKSGTPDKDFVGWCAILSGVRCVREVGERAARDVTRFRRAEKDLVDQVRSRFGHADGTFGEGTQTSLAFAAALGLGDVEALASRLAGSIESNDGILAAGIFGSSLAYEVLGRHGHDDAIERWLLRRDDPSLLGMLSSGNGALAEQFHTFLSSFDHAMFSSYVQWFYQGLGGIHVDDDATGCDRVTIRPYLSHATDRVDVGLGTVRGAIRVRWERDGGGEVRLEVVVPDGIEARCDVPRGYDVLRADEGARGGATSRRLLLRPSASA